MHPTRHQPMPADPASVAAYLADWAAQGACAATVRTSAVHAIVVWSGFRRRLVRHSAFRMLRPW